MRLSLSRQIYFSLCVPTPTSPWVNHGHPPPWFLSLSQLSTPPLNLIYLARLRNSDLFIPYFASLMTPKYSWKFCPNVTSEVSPYLFMLGLFASLPPLSSHSCHTHINGHFAYWIVIACMPHVTTWIWSCPQCCTLFADWAGASLSGRSDAVSDCVTQKYVRCWLLGCSTGLWALCRWGLHRTGLLSPVGLGRAPLGRPQVGFSLWYLRQAEFQTTRCQCCLSYWGIVRAMASTPCLVLMELGVQRIWQD